MDIGKTLSFAATRLPHKTALIYGENSYTYDELNRYVNRLSHGLLAKGIKKGDKVALMMKNSDQFIITFYAILKAGGVAVPINFRLAVPEVDYILKDSDSVMVLFDDEYLELIQQSTEDNTLIKNKVSVGTNKLDGQIFINELITSDETNPQVELTDTDDCEILYTSGTTGLPKGALFDHQRIFFVGVNMMALMTVNTNDVLLHTAPLFHSAELNLFMVPGIFLGSTHVVHKDFHPVETFKAIEEHKISIFFGVPTMYNFLLQVPNRNEYDLSSVKRCGYGAAPMSVSLIKKSMELFGHQQFYNLAGLTEGGPGGVALTPEYHLDKIGAAGIAIPHTEARVVDENGNNVEVGKIGEFLIRGETIMKEYYKKPEETQKAVRDGWLYTGDLATIDEDGYITLVDRKKDMIIAGGENVYSTEVENVIYSHPQILEVAVIGIPDEVWGETVAAIIVPKKGEELNHDELAEFCRQSLGGYKVPRVFYEIDQLPRNASGKVLKYQLRKKYTSDNF